MERRIPLRTVPGDGVEHGQQFAHAGHQGDLFALAGGQQALVRYFILISRYCSIVQGIAVKSRPPVLTSPVIAPAAASGTTTPSP
jgi:hypothetical protein